MTQQNLERMLGVLTDTLALRPKDAQARTRLGEVYQALGRPAQALAAFRRAVKDEPDYAAGHAALGAFLHLPLLLLLLDPFLRQSHCLGG